MSRAPRIPHALTTGPFNLEQAKRHGLTKDHLLGASWRRLSGGYYAFHAVAHDPNVMLAAAIRRLPRRAVFSGGPAAWLHGLDFSPCEPIEVTLPLRCSMSRLVGVTLRRSMIDTGESVMRRRLPATSAVRTIADLGRRLPLVEAVAALDMALHKKLLDLVDLTSWAGAHPRYRGVARLRRAIELA